jgi:hypothetical protein
VPEPVGAILELLGPCGRNEYWHWYSVGLNIALFDPPPRLCPKGDQFPAHLTTQRTASGLMLRF